MTKKTNKKNGNNSTDPIKQIPYGISDYELFRADSYYYIDKTMYLSILEKAGRYLFFIRPRRFGKSLFISMMEAYYDVYYKDQFDELFQDTFVHKEPTPEKNTYLVLKFDFSQVNPNPDKVEDSFLEYVRGQVESFLKKYRQYLEEDGKSLLERLYDIETATDILSALSRLCRDSRAKTYIFIDEYDNFANTILSSIGKTAYHDLTHGEGFYRAFFNILKGGTSGMEAPFTRLFLTGVSPVTLDDVTSGYNIGTNVSLGPGFNRMLGFTEEDITQMIEYYRAKGLIKESYSTPFLLETMTRWYGNYLFSEDDDTCMYNPDMVLYFLRYFLENKKFPKNLIDRNVRIDYRKLRHLIIIDRDRTKTLNGNFERLQNIVENGRIDGVIKDGFPLEELTNPDNFISLLFYFGLLTIESSRLSTIEFKVPNETIRHLYYDYIKDAYNETGMFSLEMGRYNRGMEDMALNGEWEPLFSFITGRMKESLSLRDLMTGEKAVQVFLNVYLGLSDLYIIHTEKETNQGYSDIVMEPFLARYEGIRYSYIIEIKYIKRTEKAPTEKEIKKLVKEAETQLAQYSADEKLAKTLAKTTLIKLILIFRGHEAIHAAQATTWPGV